jgi:TonB-linked SusC/RagA family outer membrane protein
MSSLRSIYILCVTLVYTSIFAVQAQEIPLLYDQEKTEQNNIYAISCLGADKLSKTISFSLFDAVKGRLSGYNNFVMRGYSSVNQGPVMFLLDGFEISPDFINNIDIEEIESVTLMKDAASTALFGQKSANGILSIKTKRGSVGKPDIKVEGAYGFNTITEKPVFFNSYEYTGFYNEALQNDGLPALYSENERNRYKDGNPEYYPNTNWYNEALKNNAPLGKIGLTVQGGSPVIKYFVYANYFSKKGFFKGTEINHDYSSQEKHDRFNFRSNFDIRVFEKTNIKADVGGYIYELNKPRYSNYEIYDALQTMPPVIQGVYNDGKHGGSATYRNNPLALISNSGYSKQHMRSFNFSFKLTQDLDAILNGLRFHGIVNILNMGLYGDSWSKDFMTENRTESGINRYGFESELWYGTSFSQLRSMGTNIYFDYNKSWDDSNLTGLIGYRQSSETMSGRDQNVANVGTYGQVSYTKQNKYFADLVLGYNGSQNFASDKRFGFFPALAAGWLISEEDYFKSDFVKLLKLRASIGLTGSDYVPYDYKFMYFQSYKWDGGYNLGNDNSWQGGIAEGMPAYPGAKWENSLKTNIGVDADLNSQFNIGIDFFIDKRSDILVSRSGKVPGMIGISLPYDNKGKVRTYGIETTLEYNYKVNDFALNIGGFFNFNKSKIIEMNEIPRPHAYLERTNKPIGQYFGLETLGFFRDQADIDNSPRQLFSEVKPGDIKYKDQNNDGVIDEFDEIAIGKSWIPEITFAFYPSVSYKNFTVEALFNGVANRSVYLNTSQFWGFYNQRNIASNATEGRWIGANKENATMPRLTTLDNKNNYRLNDLWLVNGNFVKLRYIEVRYNFPEKTMKNLKIKNAQLYVRAYDLFSFDHIKDTDPENLGPEPTYSLKNIGVKLTF